jgi:glucokinase
VPGRSDRAGAADSTPEVSAMAKPPPVYLAGDIGATNARLALATLVAGRVEWLHSALLPAAQLGGFDDALDRLFAQSPVPRTAVGAACLGIAAPVRGRRADLTNRAWSIDADAIAASLSGADVTLVNDLEAAAAGIDALAPGDLAALQEGAGTEAGARLLVGAGTGLGVAYVIRCAGGRLPVASEAGHIGFSPQTARQTQLHEALRASCGRVEAETVVSGAGLERIYSVLRGAGAGSESPALAEALRCGDGAAAISRHALAGDPLASAALDLFVECYGAFAGDQALSVLAHGGVFVVGGIAPRILPRLAAGAFLRAFNDKGRFAKLAQSFPVAVVTDDRLGLLGAALLASGRAASPRTARRRSPASGLRGR